MLRHQYLIVSLHVVLNPLEETLRIQETFNHFYML